MDEYLIYPKQFQRVNIPIEKNRCFVIMPFKEEMDYIYGIIKKGLSDRGFSCYRVDELPGSTPIINKIISEILKSRYIIADLTDRNPNVFYELGIAHSFKEAQNIIIIKRKDSKIPFDLTHLTYIEYTEDNAKFLVSSIIKSIEKSKVYTSFQEALNYRGIIPYVKENGDFFISYIQSELGNKINEITQILVENLVSLDEIEINDLLKQYEGVIRKTIQLNDDTLMNGILKVYFEMLITTAHFSSSQIQITNFLNGFFLYGMDVSFTILRGWQTDLAVALAKANKSLNTVMPWIIKYFSETKTASIDLNRYKLESFLMISDSQIVNEIICDSVFDNNCYIREHMSDIIGEKRLTQGVESICRQLRNEENYYSAVSEIEALGKLKDSIAIDYIIEWINENEKRIIEEKQFFVLKHAKIAIVKLNISSSKLKIFDEKYNAYLNDYFIL